MTFCIATPSDVQMLTHVLNFHLAVAQIDKWHVTTSSGIKSRAHTASAIHENCCAIHSTGCFQSIHFHHPGHPTMFIHSILRHRSTRFDSVANSATRYQYQQSKFCAHELRVCTVNSRLVRKHNFIRSFPISFHRTSNEFSSVLNTCEIRENLSSHFYCVNRKEQIEAKNNNNIALYFLCEYITKLCICTQRHAYTSESPAKLIKKRKKQEKRNETKWNAEKQKYTKNSLISYYCVAPPTHFCGR